MKLYFSQHNSLLHDFAVMHTGTSRERKYNTTINFVYLVFNSIAFVSLSITSFNYYMVWIWLRCAPVLAWSQNGAGRWCRICKDETQWRVLPSPRVLPWERNSNPCVLTKWMSLVLPLTYPCDPSSQRDHQQPWDPYQGQLTVLMCRWISRTVS